MGKDLKEQFQEKQQKSREQFRRSIFEKIDQYMDEWKTHAESLNRKRISEYANNVRKMEKIYSETREIEGDLSQIRIKTIQEIKTLKRWESWKFYGCCYLASLGGSLTAVIIVGRYWPAIRSFLS